METTVVPPGSPGDPGTAAVDANMGMHVLLARGARNQSNALRAAVNLIACTSVDVAAAYAAGHIQKTTVNIDGDQVEAAYVTNWRSLRLHADVGTSQRGLLLIAEALATVTTISLGQTLGLIGSDDAELVAEAILMACGHRPVPDLEA